MPASMPACVFQLPLKGSGQWAVPSAHCPVSTVQLRLTCGPHSKAQAPTVARTGAESKGGRLFTRGYHGVQKGEATRWDGLLTGWERSWGTSGELDSGPGPLPLKHACRDPGRHDDGLSREIHQCNTIGKPAPTSNTCKVGGSVLDTTRREMDMLTARPLPRSQGACHTHSASSKLP